MYILSPTQNFKLATPRYSSKRDIMSKQESDTERKLRIEAEKLEREVSGLQQQILTSNCETSSSKDARKMYGDTTPGDITHQDVVLEYSGFFKHAFRNLPKTLTQEKDLDKYRIWEICGEIMKESYESNKEVIVEKMISRMRTALEGSHSSIPPADEDTVDAMRAFTFLLNHLPHDELKKKVKEHLPNEDKDILELVMDIITLLPPSDHKPLISDKP